MNTEQIKVEYLDHMGSDLMVVNAARTSFGKESTWDYGPPTEHLGYNNEVSYRQKKVLNPADANLIRYLATGYRTKEWDAFLDEIESLVLQRHFNADEGDPRGELTKLLHAYKRRAQHWAPFAHPHLSLRMKLPMFLARQFVKHQVGGVWSEESRRYIDDEPGVWFPDEWHSRPDDVKQGSGDPAHDQASCHMYAEMAVGTALREYDNMLKDGIAPEEARIVLPLNTMTTVTWTGSLLFWSRVCNQRVDSHAQRAAQELGRQIADIARPRYPVSWDALVGAPT